MSSEQDKVEAIRKILETHDIHAGEAWHYAYWQEQREFLAREILKLFPEYEPVELEALGDEEIRFSCLGEGRYWAGERYETASDPQPVLMPQFRNVAQAQRDKDQREIEGGKE